MDVGGTCVNGRGRYLRRWMWAVLTLMYVGGTYATVCVTEYCRHVLFHERLVTVGIAYLPVRCDAIVTGVAFEFVVVVLNARKNPRCTYYLVLFHMCVKLDQFCKQQTIPGLS